MTKAEKIFHKTYYECLHYVRHWGLLINNDGSVAGYNKLISEHGESVCMRTCNDFRKYMNSEHRLLDLMEKYGIRTKAELQERRDALRMVQSTLNNQIKTLHSC